MSLPFLSRSARRPAHRPTPRILRARPQVTELENRTVPATFFWTGNGLTPNWSDSLNWSQGAPFPNVPGSGDDIVFPAGALRLANTDDIPNLTVSSLTIDGAGYSLNAALGTSLGLDGDLTVDNPTGTNTINIPLTFVPGGVPGPVSSQSVTNVFAGTTLNLTGALFNSARVLVNVDGAGNTNITGVVSGPGALAKVGTGTLSLTAAASTYSGGTTLTAGVLQLRSGGALGTGTLDIQGGRLRASGPAVTVTNPVVLDGDVEFAGSLPLTFTQGQVTLTGNRTLTVDNTTAFNGAPGIGDLGLGFSLTKAGPGTLVLGAQNGYGGGTVLDAGALVIGNNGAAGSGPLTVRGGELDDDGTARTVANGLFLTGDFALGGAGRLTFTGPTTLTANVTVTAASLTGADALNGVIGEDGTARRLTKAGPGTLALGAANTFSGGTVLEAGSLGVENASAFGAGVLTLAGGTLTSDLPAVTVANPVRLGANVRFGTTGPSTAYNFSGPVTLTADSTLDVRTPTTFGGVIDQDRAGRALTKAGSADLTLSGNNTYTGQTTVAGGRLVINGAQPDSDVVVGRHGTLAGTGTVGDVTVAGGTLAPGAPTGTLQGNLTVTLAPLSTFVARLDGSAPGTFAQLNAQQAVTLGGRLLPAVGPSSTMAAGDTVTIIQSAAGVTGTFAGLPNNSLFTAGGGKFKITYTSTAVTLTRMAVATAVRLTSSLNPAPRGQPVTFTATVLAPVGGGTPTGVVTFMDGTRVLGTVALTNGTASFQTTALAVGLHRITAIYKPDFSAFTKSTSAALTERITL